MIEYTYRRPYKKYQGCSEYELGALSPPSNGPATSPKSAEYRCPQMTQSGQWIKLGPATQSPAFSERGFYGFGFFTSPLPHPALNSSALIFPSPSPSTSLKLTM